MAGLANPSHKGDASLKNKSPEEPKKKVPGRNSVGREYWGLYVRKEEPANVSLGGEPKDSFLKCEKKKRDYDQVRNVRQVRH